MKVFHQLARLSIHQHRSNARIKATSRLLTRYTTCLLTFVRGCVGVQGRNEIEIEIPTILEVFSHPELMWRRFWIPLCEELV